MLLRRSPSPTIPVVQPHRSAHHQRHQTTPAPTTIVAPPAPPIAARRNLIGAYLARNAASPPAIFKPSFQAFSPPPALQLAYTHPALLLLNDDDDDEDEVSKDVPRTVEQNRDIGVTYITDTSSIELLDASAIVTKRSPPAVFRLKRHRTAFASVDLLNDEAATIVEKEPARLIGNVTATLIKTWEQLNAAANAPTRSTTATLLHSSASGDFYDSIDDDDQFVSELERIPSMCDAIDNGDDELHGCGEIDGGSGSLLDKRKICWSMDSS